MNIIERNSKQLRTEIKAKPFIRDVDNSKGGIIASKRMWTEKKRITSKIAFDNLLRQDDALSNMLNIEKENEMNCVNMNIDTESSATMSKFLSKIPKPSSTYSIKFDKYVDMPTKIPKLK